MTNCLIIVLSRREYLICFFEASVVISFPSQTVPFISSTTTDKLTKYSSITISRMQLLSSKWKSIVKSYNHYMHPNDNPTQHDRTAFDLLSKAETDMFIQYCESHPVNMHVRDYNTVSLLIKAQDVANDTHPCKKLLSPEERMDRAVKATRYLLDKGVDINYRDKSGGTALYSAVHWQNRPLVELLLSRGADPNIGSSQHFINLPIISAMFKQDMEMIILLISYGAEVEKALELSNSPQRGFELTESQKDTLRSASNLQGVIRQRRYQIAAGKNTVLALLSQAQFQEMCFYM